MIQKIDLKMASFLLVRMASTATFLIVVVVTIIITFVA